MPVGALGEAAGERHAWRGGGSLRWKNRPGKGGKEALAVEPPGRRARPTGARLRRGRPDPGEPGIVSPEGLLAGKRVLVMRAEEGKDRFGGLLPRRGPRSFTFRCCASWVACLGEVTAQAARELDIFPEIVPSRATLEELAAAIAQALTPSPKS